MVKALKAASRPRASDGKGAPKPIYLLNNFNIRQKFWKLCIHPSAEKS